MPVDASGLTGANIIAGNLSTEGSSTFESQHPATGQRGETRFHEATEHEVARAAEAAAVAFRTYRSWGPDRIAPLLRAAAEQLEQMDDVLCRTADAETGLGRGRLDGELARTCGQFRMFADHVRSGDHLEAVVDHADTDAAPPRPDLRRMQVALGPVAVFGASNFPLAFSVPGGDTAAALAAGCSVVIKAHPSHPATSELAANALLRACESVGAPTGLVNLVHGPGIEVGRALVLAEPIRAVAFTGSTAGGLALQRLSADRPQPIPVHAEMGSVNPLVVTARALEERAEDIADGFVGSVSLGTGQFCTKPGLIFVPEGSAGDAFTEAVAARLREVGPSTLLNEGIRDALAARLADTQSIPGVETLVAPGTPTGGGVTCEPALLSVDWSTYQAHATLREEHFGPVAVVVRYPEHGLVDALESMEGSLTISLHAEEQDLDAIAALRDRLVERAGRILWNGFPTGVAVVPAQHHGGPFPATTDPRFTSVGTGAIKRFLRPVAFQNAPESLLPEALREANPLGIRRLVDGTFRV